MSSLVWGLVFTVAYAAGPATSTVELKTELPQPMYWSTEDIKAEIRRVFPDAPVMMDVARCESHFKPQAYNPTNGSHDGGVFQISGKYHGDRLKKLGLDPYNPKENIAYARILYDESGLSPWLASRHCWHK